MKLAAFFVLILLLQSQSGFAVDLEFTDACRRLSDVTCAPGTYDDGTGTSWSGTNEQLQKFENDRMNELARPFFDRKLKTNAAFRAQMLQMAGKPLNDQQLLDYTVAQGVAALSRKMLGFVPELAKSLKDTRVGRWLFKKTLNEEALYGDFFEYVRSRVVDAALAAQVAREFTSVRLELISVIRDQIPAGRERDRMIDQVASVQFEGIDCSNLNAFSRSSRWDSLLVPNAFYNPGTNHFTYCNGLGHYNSSLFQRYFVIAHELTHSIDPCAFERDGRKFPAPKIVSCLRDNESVGAAKQKKYNPSKVDPAIAALGEPLTDCGGGDQIGESFADFMGAEVLSRMVSRMQPLSIAQKRTGFANAMRFPGECKEAKGFDVHPATRARIDRIIFANTTIQDEMQCPSTSTARQPKYCGKH